MPGRCSTPGRWRPAPPVCGTPSRNSTGRRSPWSSWTKQQFQALPASIANAWAYVAQALGDIPGSVIHARRALDLLPDDDYLSRGQAAALLGLAEWAMGDLDAGPRLFGPWHGQF